MAIEMQCPQCKKAYRLKDELTGKKVTCANPECRTQFVVTLKPGTGTAPSLAALRAPGAKSPAARPARAPGTTVPPPPPAPSVDVDATASAAFADDLDNVPVETRTIGMKCGNCEHLWSEGWDKQGKNVLCPECRSRQRVPVPNAKTGKTDWRKDGMPAGRKVEQLEGVVSSGDSKYVDGGSLRAAGLGVPELEPRPLWQKVFVVAFPLALIGLTAFAYTSYSSSRRDGKEVETMKLALDDMPPDDALLPKPELPLFRAGLSIAAGEYAARREGKSPKDLTDAVGHFAKARQELEALPYSFGRDALYGELAVAQLSLGGPPDQVDAGQRLRWVPQGAGNSRAKINDKVYDVQSELGRTFGAMKNPERPAAFEARMQTLRRVTRELAKVGQAELTELLVPALFPDGEQLEATAVAGFEAQKAAPDPARAQALVATLAPGVGPGRAPPAALIALAQGSPDAPAALRVAPYSPGAGPLEDGPRTVYGMVAVLKNAPGEAIEVARRPGRTDSRLRLLALVAELSPEPAAAVAAAAEVFSTDGRKREFGEVPDALLVRLAAQAGRANQPDKADLFVKAVARDDARAWARAEALRGQFLGGTPRAADEALAEAPADPKDARVGMAWGRLWVSRANAAAGERKPPESFDRWGKGTFRPYGLAGQALGLQDRK